MSTAPDPTLQGTAQPPPAGVRRQVLRVLAAAPDLSGWDIDNDALAHAMAGSRATTGVNAHPSRCCRACR
jgi:hypothetical protein